jgi:peptidyl-prolyl cis-trans isomerase D
MATLQNLRNRAGVLLASLIFIALAAFVLGDFMKSGSSIMRGKQLQIADIDGESVDYPEFQSKYDEIAAIYKSNNQTNTLDENAHQQVLNQAWETLVQEKIMSKIYENLGIQVTSEEMFDMVQGKNLHPIIMQIFGDPQTHKVNKSNVIQFLKYIEQNPTAPQKASWMNIEKQLLTTKKLSKYTDLVGKSLYANSLQAKQSIPEKNITASLKFIQKKFADVSDTQVSYSESDLKKYYEEHKEDFDMKAKRSIAYVVFNIVPSAEDDQDAQNWINKIKTEFAEATDNVQFVNMNADNRFADKYVKESDLNPTVAMWAFAANVNDVYGPIKDGNTYKLYKLNNTKMLPDSVQASHILIKVENAEAAQSASKAIDSLKTKIDLGLITFEQAAKDNSQDGSAAQGGDLGWFKSGMMVPEFEKAAFNAEKGEVVKVQTQFGFHLIKVTAQGIKTKHVQLAVIDREVIASSATYQKIYTEANKFAANAQNLEGFNKYAAQQQLTKRNATVGENDRSIASLGAVRNVIRAAFTEAKIGDLVVDADKSPVFEVDNKFIVAAVESAEEDGIRPFGKVKSSVELAVIKEKKEEKLYKDFSAAKGSSIEQSASQLGLSVDNASGFRLAYGSVNAIGYDPAINGAVAALKVNEVSKPIVGKIGVYMIQLTEKDGSETGNINAEKQSLYAGSSYRANYQAFEAIKKHTEIVDKRSKFY